MEYTKNRLGNNNHTLLYQWTGLTADSVGAPLFIEDKADKTFHIYGDRGVDASVSLVGSNKVAFDKTTNVISLVDTDDAVVLQDTLGNNITATATAILGTVIPHPALIWPVVTGGDEDTLYTVSIYGVSK